MSNFSQAERDAIQVHLAKLQASSAFAQAERLSRFLKFVISEVLAGRGDRLNQYTLGIEIFNRRETFDPAVDSVVRVEAGRLRSKWPH